MSVSTDIVIVASDLAATSGRAFFTTAGGGFDGTSFPSGATDGVRGYTATGRGGVTVSTAPYVYDTAGGPALIAVATASVTAVTVLAASSSPRLISRLWLLCLCWSSLLRLTHSFLFPRLQLRCFCRVSRLRLPFLSLQSRVRLPRPLRLSRLRLRQRLISRFWFLRQRRPSLLRLTCAFRFPRLHLRCLCRVSGLRQARISLESRLRLPRHLWF